MASFTTTQGRRADLRSNWRPPQRGAPGRKLRITFVLPFAGTAGGTRVVATYADRLQRRGHEVTVISTPRPKKSLRESIRSLLLGRGWPQPLGPSHLDRVDVDHRIIDSYRPITNDDLPDADIVIATWWETAEWVAKLSPTKGSKVYFIQHDESHLNQPAERVEATWHLPMHKITIAKWLVDLAHRRCADLNIALVPNAVDFDQFNARPRSKQSVPTVGMMYSLASFKGSDIALRAFDQAAVPGLRLVAFGSQHPTAALPLPKNTEFFQNPPQEKICEIYARCDAWLFASRSEGFGLPILEAMACRTPVIATPAGAAPELLSSGAGLLVKPADAADMARAIERICRMDSSGWQHLSELAYQTATRYSWDDATQLFEAALLRAAPATHSFQSLHHAGENRAA